MRRNRILFLFALVALAGAIVATQVESCELMDGGLHVVTSCPAGILPVPLVLGLMALSMVFTINLAPRPQLVLISIDRPPRLVLAS